MTKRTLDLVRQVFVTTSSGDSHVDRTARGCAIFFSFLFEDQWLDGGMDSACDLDLVGDLVPQV